MARLSVLFGIIVWFASVLVGQNPSTTNIGLPKRQKLLLTYERTTCYGTCPSFLVSVYKDGRVAYEGRKFVKIAGKAEFKLSDDQSQRLALAIKNSGFRSLRASFIDKGCTVYFTDDYWVYVTVIGQERTKRVTHYLGCHGGSDSFRNQLRRLATLEKAIEEITEIEGWIGTEEERSKFPHPLVKN